MPSTTTTTAAWGPKVQWHPKRLILCLFLLIIAIHDISSFTSSYSLAGGERYPSRFGSARIMTLSSVSYLGDPYEDNGMLFEKYDMVELPDSMVDTTVWIGNLDEFVSDIDLADLILSKSCGNDDGGGGPSISPMFSVPCAIARRPNNDSLGYGFVTFPSRRDACIAVNIFDGYEFEGGRLLKVQHFKDSRYARAKVPEKLVAYVVGTNKKLPNGAKNNLRRISRKEVAQLSKVRRSTSRKKKVICQIYD